MEDENFSLFVFALKILGQFCHWLLARQVVAKLKHPKMMRSCTWANENLEKNILLLVMQRGNCLQQKCCGPKNTLVAIDHVPVVVIVVVAVATAARSWHCLTARSWHC